MNDHESEMTGREIAAVIIIYSSPMEWNEEVVKFSSKQIFQYS